MFSSLKTKAVLQKEILPAQTKKLALTQTLHERKWNGNKYCKTSVILLCHEQNKNIHSNTHKHTHSSLKFKCNWSEEGGKVADILLQSITSVPLNWKTVRPEKRASPAGSWNGMLGVASQHAWSKGFKARPQLPEINTKPAKTKTEMMLNH